MVSLYCLLLKLEVPSLCLFTNNRLSSLANIQLLGGWLTACLLPHVLVPDTGMTPSRCLVNICGRSKWKNSWLSVRTVKPITGGPRHIVGALSFPPSHREEPPWLGQPLEPVLASVNGQDCQPHHFSQTWLLETTAPRTAAKGHVEDVKSFCLKNKIPTPLSQGCPDLQRRVKHQTFGYRSLRAALWNTTGWLFFSPETIKWKLQLDLRYDTAYLKAWS